MKLVSIKKTWHQDADSCTSEDQYLTLKSDDAGGGPFLVISTKRWSIDLDEIDNFIKLIKSFIKEIPKDEQN